MDEHGINVSPELAQRCQALGYGRLQLEAVLQNPRLIDEWECRPHSILNNTNHQGQFVCCLTQDIVQPPCYVIGGHMYTTPFFIIWYNQNGTNPLSRETMNIMNHERLVIERQKYLNTYPEAEVQPITRSIENGPSQAESQAEPYDDWENPTNDWLNQLISMNQLISSYSHFVPDNWDDWENDFDNTHLHRSSVEPIISGYTLSFRPGSITNSNLSHALTNTPGGYSYLNLSEQRLEGHVRLSLHPSIAQVDLSSNPRLSSISFSPTTRLVSLRAQGCGLTQLHLENDIQIIEVSNNHISDITLRYAPMFLDLANNNLTSWNHPELAINDLDLSGNRLTRFPATPSLITLNLSSNPITRLENITLPTTMTWLGLNFTPLEVISGVVYPPNFEGPKLQNLTSSHLDID